MACASDADSGLVEDHVRGTNVPSLRYVSSRFCSLDSGGREFGLIDAGRYAFEHLPEKHGRTIRSVFKESNLR